MQTLSKGVWGAGSPRNVLVFNSLSPLSWVFESLRQHIAQVSTWKVFFIIKNIFIMKNLTDFRKTVETGVDLRLLSPSFLPLPTLTDTFAIQQAAYLCILRSGHFLLKP